MNLPETYQKIQEALVYLNKNQHEQPSLYALAKSLNWSESHCQRQFKKWVGISPKNFLQALTLTKSKELLRSSATLEDVSFEMGLSGTSRLHDLFVRIEKMTPGEYKAGGKGIEISWGEVVTSLGHGFIGVTSKGLCYLDFCDHSRSNIIELEQRWPQAHFKKMSVTQLKYWQKKLYQLVQGKPGGPLSLHLSGTDFQITVWEALLKIPEGKLTTYQQLAHMIKKPQAARAVGSAVGANPIAQLIPCHRVIRSTGVIGEYHWGKDRKELMIAIELARHCAD